MSTGQGSTLKPVKRPANDQVWAWRHAYYDYRKACQRVRAGRNLEAMPYLEGPHARYVRARFRAIGRHDPRFISALALCNAIDSAAPVSREPEPPSNQPTVTVAAEIADAFGMRELPDTIVVDSPRESTPATNQPAPPTNQAADDEYGRALEHFANELTARRKSKGANGYTYQLTRDSNGRDQIERTSPNHALTSIIQGTVAGYFATTSAAITWAMDNQKRDPFPGKFAAPCESTPPTNQAGPPTHQPGAVNPSPEPEPAVTPPTNQPASPLGSGKFIVNVQSLLDALRSMKQTTPDSVRTNPDNRRKFIHEKRIRFQSIGEVLRVSSLDYPAAPFIDIKECQIDQPGEFAMLIDLPLKILALSNDDTMSLAVEGGELHIRGADSHYKLFTINLAAAAAAHQRALLVAEPKLTPKQWLERALSLAASVQLGHADTQTAFESHQKRGTDAMRRKLAWCIIKQTSPEASNARAALLACAGREKLEKWLGQVLGMAVTLN